MLTHNLVLSEIIVPQEQQQKTYAQQELTQTQQDFGILLSAWNVQLA